MPPEKPQIPFLQPRKRDFEPFLLEFKLPYVRMFLLVCLADVHDPDMLFDRVKSQRVLVEGVNFIQQ